METSPILDQNKDYIGALACVADISKRKKADFEQAGRMAMDDDKPVNDSMNKAASDKGSKLNEE